MGTIADATRRIQSVNEKLDATKMLFNAAPDFIDDMSIGFPQVKVETIFDANNVLILIAYYTAIGGSLPVHTHKDSLEYLISIKGQHLLKFPNGAVRIMEQGECATIPVGVDHTTASLTEDAQLLAICIPPEMAYRKVSSGDK